MEVKIRFFFLSVMADIHYVRASTVLFASATALMELIGVMIFLGYFLIYVVRYNLSVHIVDMARLELRHTPHSKMLIARSEKQKLRNRLDILNWDDWKVARLFSAYYVGFCVCFPIFHNLGDRLGPTWVVGIAGMTSGALNCLTPASAYFNFWCLLFVRITAGFCAGAMQPSLVQVLRYWVPPVERIHYMWTYCGVTTGTFSTLIFCAMIQYYFHWPLGYYIAGALQMIWAAVWVLFVTDKPRKHPCITDNELSYLSNTIGTVFTIKLTNSQIPWKLIMVSAEFWALCILDFGYAWMIMALCLYGPLYYAIIGKHSIFKASMLTALPFLLRLILGTIMIQTFHWYEQNKSIRRIKHIRKYFIVVSHVIPGLLLAASWFFNVIPGPILLTIALSFTAAGMDLALDLTYALTPTYANSLSSVIKIIANTPGIIIPFCVGIITQQYPGDSYIWKYVWSFHGTVLLVSGIIFLIWGDTKVQPWNSVRISPPVKVHAMPRPSMMSNIPELDEDDSTIQISPPSKKRSLMSTVSLKMLLPKKY